MASIIPVAGGFRATVTRKSLGFRKSKTFPRKGDAQKWARAIETDIDLHGVPEPAPESQTIAALIEEYIRRHQAIQPLGRSKYATLKQIVRFGIAQLTPDQINQQVVQQHLEKRRADGTGPATVNNDLITLRTVLKYHGIAKHRAAIDAIDDAATVAKSMGVLAKAEQRDRRPTESELIILTQHFATTRHDWMAEVMWFAIYSCRRQSEIAGLLHADNDPDEMTGLVRGLKDPLGRKINERFKYTEQAWQIVQRQPESEDGRIFPHSALMISKNFTADCKLLGIEDLRFHDLRHEGVSRLFELGMSIPEVALHSLHKQWSTLQRYANLDPANAGKKVDHIHLDQIALPGHGK